MELLHRLWHTVYRFFKRNKTKTALMPNFPHYATAGRSVFTARTAFGPVFVRENRRYRWLYFGEEGIQSAMLKRHPDELVFAYLRAMTLLTHLVPTSSKALCLGLGGGSLVQALHQADPALGIDAIELNPVVVDVAHTYFHFEGHDNINLHIEDASEFLTKTDAQYDMIFVDLFLGTTLLDRLLHIDFYTLCQSRLTPQGGMCINVVVDNALELQHVLNIIKSVFPSKPFSIYADDHQNLVIFAFNTPIKNEQLYHLAGQGLLETLEFDNLLGIQAKLKTD